MSRRGVVFEPHQAVVGVIDAAEDSAVGGDPEPVLMPDEERESQAGGDERGEVGEAGRELHAGDAFAEEGPEHAVGRVEELAGAGKSVVERAIELLHDPAVVVEDHDAGAVDGGGDEAAAEVAEIVDSLPRAEHALGDEGTHGLAIEELQSGSGGADEEQARGVLHAAGDHVVDVCAGRGDVDRAASSLSDFVHQAAEPTGCARWRKCG